MSSSYTKIEFSRNQILIPLARSSAVCSKYDPQKEAETFAAQFKDSDLFFVVAGLCAGLHVEKLLEKNSSRKIIVVENSAEDFDFLMQIPLCKKLSEDKRIIFSTPQKIFSDILQNYFPAVYGTLTFCFLRGWENAFHENFAVIKTLVEKAIQSVKADFAVQAHFGKIWQKNIFENLKIHSMQKKSGALLKSLKSKNNRICAVIAAGPSLDDSIQKLKENPDRYFIIATDTAYSVLLKSQILPDVVVSIDGQNISRAHFLHQNLYKNLKKDKNTVFALDLCANSSISKKLFEQNEELVFFSSGHPLSNLARFFNGENFPALQSGSGTVTIAAADLGFSLEFTQFDFLGADFCYSRGKPYAKGTYLDDIYFKAQNRLETVEKKYCALMFRTELIKQPENDGGNLTTEVMNGYKKSFEYYLNSPKTPVSQAFDTLNLTNFKNRLKTEVQSLSKNYLEALGNPVFYALLPLMAFYEKTADAGESYKLARANLLRYTENI